MKNENRVFEPFLLVLCSLVIFVGLSFVNTEFSAAGYSAKKIHLFSDVIASGRVAVAPAVGPVVNDSMMKKRGVFMKPDNKHSAEIVEFGDDSLGGLIRFFMAIEQLKTKGKQVRIAYFGDSMIEGDLISQDLRALMQDTFGGYGVGFMPITSIVAGFRQSIIHSFSTNWTDHNLLEKNSGGHAPGITGHTFVPAFTGQGDSTITGSWVKYTAPNRARLDRFYNVRLFYGKTESACYVNCNKQNHKLDGVNAVNQLYVNRGGAIQAVQAGFSCGGPLDVYGFSMDTDSGVFVDNLSYRGNSGLPLTQMPYRVLNGLNQHLDYDLIILQYGPNVVNSKLKSYDWYEKGMVEVVKHLKQAFPTASILVISTGDKGYRKNGVMGTDPAVPILVESQRKTAEKTGAAFWNLYQAMGGEASMVKWVQGDTVYANKDYTHFNHRGAKRIGKMLFDRLMNEYKSYKKSAT
ncbi:MAG: hypothetical protein FD123_3312 [Bacteroidetes bacterium]|nr:MAG: hypothetical protein FD123_3312 [Bacteroidota bacterium]